MSDYQIIQVIKPRQIPIRLSWSMWMTLAEYLMTYCESQTTDDINTKLEKEVLIQVIIKISAKQRRINGYQNPQKEYKISLSPAERTALATKAAIYLSEIEEGYLCVCFREVIDIIHKHDFNNVQLIH